MAYGQIHNIGELKDRRRSLRNNATNAEKFLWTLLKGQQLEGRKFRRQHSVGCYVLDFYCPQEKLAVELDGAHHYTPKGLKHDEKRTCYLNTLDIRVIRFENIVVLRQKEFVLGEIRKMFGGVKNKPPSFGPAG